MNATHELESGQAGAHPRTGIVMSHCLHPLLPHERSGIGAVKQLDRRVPMVGDAHA